MISAADVDLERVEACGMANQLRCVLPPRPLHDITRITSVRQYAARATVARELSEVDVGIADRDADEEERCGLEKVAADTYGPQEDLALLRLFFDLHFLGGLVSKWRCLFYVGRFAVGWRWARAVGLCLLEMSMGPRAGEK
jgi:hypothetical protein